ncbi:nucleotide disphospho-sugar-binding domain-containing protein [Micromonospora sp. DT231]|uniref:nucleotide disphospho-sugar-binding domain-containing protein n=1 Tax=Micromonospora sp. DT231 TaxID=3416526 RepID=UPI003CF49A2D
MAVGCRPPAEASWHGEADALNARRSAAGLPPAPADRPRRDGRHRRHPGAGLLFGALNDRLIDPVVTLATGWRPDLVLHEPFAVAVAVAPPSVARQDGWPMRYDSYVGGGELPAWLRQPGERPRILVTRSTVTGPGDRGPMPAVVAAAAEVDPEIVLVRPDQRSARSLPGNVRVVDWIPLDVALPVSAALVHHGGAGSAFGALAAGLPQLATTGPGDRRHNAELVARRGAGLALRPRDITARALTQLLTDERLRTAAVQVSREIAAMPPPADLVARLAALV